METEHVIKDIEIIKLMLDPRRFRIMKFATDEPITVKQLAEKLDEKPSRLYYHVNKMEELGLLKLVETKQQGNLIEKYYQTDKDVSRSYNIDPVAAQQNSSVIMQELSRITNQALQVIEQGILAGPNSEQQCESKVAYKSMTKKQWEKKLKAYDVIMGAKDDVNHILLNDEKEEENHANSEQSQVNDEKEDYVFVMLAYRLKDAENN
ncbi:ArsR/SmtB family transcription factor [Paenibacillus sp. KN14-4R]|uniref:ArsR/SmtB family transcription factor n=1 Tax=Paenibacillus sp. KN14-4R TaxID=3445773 RepID=UPI003F9FD7B0